VRYVIAIHFARIHGKPHVVWIKFYRTAPIGNDFSGQIDIEYETTPHIQKRFPTMLSTDRATGLRNTPRHTYDLKCLKH